MGGPGLIKRLQENTAGPSGLLRCRPGRVISGHSPLSKKGRDPDKRSVVQRSSAVDRVSLGIGRPDWTNSGPNVRPKPALQVKACCWQPLASRLPPKKFRYG